MNKRIISFICVGLVATSCVSSLCFYDYFANDGTTIGFSTFSSYPYCWDKPE